MCNIVNASAQGSSRGMSCVSGKPNAISLAEVSSVQFQICHVVDYYYCVFFIYRQQHNDNTIVCRLSMR